eukprot:7678887-Alexandrium_andersonii.AAC.1
MYGRSIPFVDPTRTGEPLLEKDIQTLADAQGEEMDPFVWYTAPGIFTSSLKPASCPESLVVSSRAQGLLPEVTEAGAL